MRWESSQPRGGKAKVWAFGLTCVALLTGVAPALAQKPTDAPPTKLSDLAAPTLAAAPAAPDANVTQASCSTCSGGLLGGSLGGPPPLPGDGGGCGGGGCGGGQCVPGRLNCCSCCEGQTCLGRMLCGFYECICCPDPCYDPHWIALADSALFVNAPRPVTQMHCATTAFTASRSRIGLNTTSPGTRAPRRAAAAGRTSTWRASSTSIS